MSAFKPHFRPRLLDCLKDYRGETFAADLGAGFTVGLVALPLAMAFAIASGVKPESGIFTAIIAGFIISALGGSKVQIGGPAGAFIVIIYGIVQQYGLANLLIATMMAGVLLFIMGLTGLGSFIRFVPISIIVGFTNGIAVLIALSQVKDFLGLDIEKMPADFFSQVALISRHIGTIDLPTVALASVSLAFIVGWPRLMQLLVSVGDPLTGRARLFLRLPGTVVTLMIATTVVAFSGMPVETIGSRFGGIPESLPALALPEFNWQTARNLVGPTLTIALLGAIESLLCARVADAMINDRHDPNQELMAQGVANLVTPLFGGLPATGTIARTTTNVRTGARTPVAGMVHAAVLLAIVLLGAKFAAWVPLASLAAILVFVAWNMGEWREFTRLSSYTPSDRIILIVTFLLTVIFDLTVAVEVGLVLASVLFIYRMSELTRVEPVEIASLDADDHGTLLAAHHAQHAAAGHGIACYRVSGALFFGAVGKIEQLLDQQRDRISVVILEMHQLVKIDTTGLDAVETLLRVLREEGRHLVLSGVTRQPMSLLRDSGFITQIGEANVVGSLPAAISRAGELAGTRPPPPLHTTH